MGKFSFAIIGGGPAAFYTSKLLLRFPCEPLVHIYQKQLCPFGLIRYGVAPDHVSIKKSQTRLSEETTHPNFKYFGNVQVTKTGLQQLRKKYSGIIYAYGASQNHCPQWLLPTSNPHPYPYPHNLPPNTKFARDLVYWYNGHPQNSQSHQNLQPIKNICIIGNGNVAIDIARILLQNVKNLQKTEISKPALQELKQCNIQNIEIIGRRGVTHSAFSVKEIRELSQLGIKIYAIREELEDSMTPASQVQCTAIGDHFNSVVRMNKRKIDFIKNNCTIIREKDIQKQKQNPQKKVFLRYLLNPISVSQNAKSLQCQKVHLQGNPFKQTIIPTQNFSTINYDLLVLSTGFEVSEIQPRHFDTEFKKVKNSDGCVVDTSVDKIDIGNYAVGWCKNGPKGVLDETLLSCQETLNNLRIHLQNGVLQQKSAIQQPKKYISFEKYAEVRQIELSKGNRQKFIKKKLTNKQLKQIYGVNEILKI